MNRHLMRQIKQLEKKAKDRMSEFEGDSLGEDTAEILVMLYLEYVQQAIMTDEKTEVWAFPELKNKVDELPLKVRRLIAKEYEENYLSDEAIQEIYELLIEENI